MPSLLPLPSCFNLGTPAPQSQCWKRWFYNMAIDGDDGHVPKIWGTFWHILTRRRIAIKKTSQCPGLSSLLRWSKWKPGQQMRRKLKTPWQPFSRSPRARRDKKTMTTGSDYQWLDSKLFKMMFYVFLFHPDSSCDEGEVVALSPGMVCHGLVRPRSFWKRKWKSPRIKFRRMWLYLASGSSLFLKKSSAGPSAWGILQRNEAFEMVWWSYELYS